MESLYLLIPLSAGLVLVILALFGWAVHGGQFEDLEGEGERILTDDAVPIDTDQAASPSQRQESFHEPGVPGRGEVQWHK